MGKKPKKKGGGGRGGSQKKSFSVGGGQEVSLSGSMPATEDFLSNNANEDHRDEVGRMFCKHDRDYCHICCVDYRMGNRVMEEAAGLKKKESELEEAARMYATSLGALKGMERMRPRPSDEVFEQNRRWRDEYRDKLDRFASQPGQRDEVQAVLRRAINKNHSESLEIQAMTEKMASLNPGQTEFEFGGDESQQKLYDEFIRAPQGNENRADYYTCAYCGKTATEKLLQCSRCKKVSYCGRDCQVAAWPAHKKHECVKVAKDQRGVELKKERLTWDQVEAHGGNPSPGKLEIKAIKNESFMMRQVFRCKDRTGMCHRIAAYTDSRAIPGLRVGATITWKYPRFHYFMDGSTGARIEEHDLHNITVT
jgi:hypothetical protein